jgi:hypothetical protein
MTKNVNDIFENLETKVDLYQVYKPRKIKAEKPTKTQVNDVLKELDDLNISK